MAAARDTAGTLRPVAEAYADAPKAAPADHYPGINALTMGRVWEHVTDRKTRLDLDLIAAGVRWAVARSLAREQTYWALITRAEAASCCRARKRPSRATTSGGAGLRPGRPIRPRLVAADLPPARAGLRPGLVAEAEEVLARTERQLDRLANGQGGAVGGHLGPPSPPV